MGSDIDDLMATLRDFAERRSWQRFHNPKNLAMAIAGEAGELAAEFQWLTPDESAKLDADAHERVAMEAADVLIYLVRLSDVLGIDLLEATRRKIATNEARFPAREGRSN